jgi:outer membrane receptor for ferrienterochelin and colicins
MKRLLVVMLVLVGQVADAQTQVSSVDVADLPPLPENAVEQATTATLLAATSASEDVVVGAAKREQSLGNVASAVTVVSADRIKRFGYRTVGEAISGVAGLYLEDNRLVDTVGIRGLNILGDFNTRILVLVDGATVNEAWGSFAGVGYDTFISIDDVARIEVIRGPVSSLYGANAFFGIINIVTRGASETPRAWGRVSVNSTNGVIASAGFATGNVHQQLRGTVQVSDRNGFGDTTTVPGIGNVGQNLSYDGGDTYALSLVGSYNGTFAQVRAYRYRRDNPWAPYDTDLAQPGGYYNYDSQLLVEGGHTEQVGDRLTLTGRVYANIYEYEDHYPQAPAMGVYTPPFDDFGDAQTYGGEARARYEIVPQKLGVTAGAEANYDNTKSHSYQELPSSTQPDPTVNALVPKTFNIEGVYAEADGQPLPWLGFTAGIRYDRNSVIDQNVSPRLALFLADHEKYGVKLLYAQGFRNPSAYEAFFYDNVTFEQAHDLHAETIESFEAVLWAKPVSGLSLRLSGFYWDAKGVVEQEIDPVTQLVQFKNIGEYVTYGLEAEGTYRLASGWYAFGGTSYEDVGCAGCGEYTSTATPMGVQYGNVPNAPAWTGTGGISTPRLWGRLHVSSDLQYVSARAARPNSDGSLNYDAPQWFGWNLAFYLPNINGFDFTAGIRNLIGTREMIVAPQDYDRTTTTSTTVIPLVPGEAREFYVKVGWSY